MEDLFVGTKVRFFERHRPPQVQPGAIGIVVDLEVRSTANRDQPWVRVRFGDFISPWVEAWQFERVD